MAKPRSSYAKHSVSVSAATHARLAARASADGIPVRRLIEPIILAALATGIAPPTKVARASALLLASPLRATDAIGIEAGCSGRRVRQVRAQLVAEGKLTRRASIIRGQRAARPMITVRASEACTWDGPARARGLTVTAFVRQVVIAALDRETGRTRGERPVAGQMRRAA